MEKWRIRPVTEADGAELLAIYAPYVTDTAITFEYQVPTLEEFVERMHRTLERYPYLLAEEEGEVLGYAYGGPFHVRAAYGWSAETSLYVQRNRRRTGVGRALYAALEEILSRQGILNLNACIAYPEGEDPYLTRDSVEFHEKMGYQWVGKFHRCGYKFHRWYHMVWMEKEIGPHLAEQPPVKPAWEILER